MATHQVHVYHWPGRGFEPRDIAVRAGDTVEWIWDSDNHSVTADDNSFDSGVLNTGATFRQTFAAAGRIPYYCVNHGAPGGVDMSGTVNVT